MPKASDNDDPVDADLAFENALEQLEELVREMESDQMPLEDLIKNYERGTRLHRICEKRLDEAQGRIEIIRKKRNGENVLEPFGDEPSGEEVESTDPEATETGDLETDGELF
ncbi:MAG: exodeoxyribonuclease VII small subunit [Verrucomicrobiales bacterium]